MKSRTTMRQLSINFCYGGVLANLLIKTFCYQLRRGHSSSPFLETLDTSRVFFYRRKRSWLHNLLSKDTRCNNVGRAYLNQWVCVAFLDKCGIYNHNHNTKINELAIRRSVIRTSLFSTFLAFFFFFFEHLIKAWWCQYHY